MAKDEEELVDPLSLRDALRRIDELEAKGKRTTKPEWTDLREKIAAVHARFPRDDKDSQLKSLAGAVFQALVSGEAYIRDEDGNLACGDMITSYADSLIDFVRREEQRGSKKG